MYEQEPEIIRDVIKFFNLSWPQILFVATHGTPTKALAAWRAEAEEEHEARQEELAVSTQRQGWGRHTKRPFEVTGKPIRFSKLSLIKFYRVFERVIWDSAYAFISSTEGEVKNRFEALGRCLGYRTDIESLNDIAAAAASWAVTEACQAIYSDYEGNSEAKEGSEEDYSIYRDIWEPVREHHELHTDVGGYDEAIMRRLRSGN
jgi:hypothetical protein